MLTMMFSPQLPTPRRSLFTSNIFANLGRPSGSLSLPRGMHSFLTSAGATTPPVRQPWEGVTTPPVPSSSPCGYHDGMDMSPLPHKQPQIPLIIAPLPRPNSPTRNQDDDMISPDETTSSNTLSVPRPALE